MSLREEHVDLEENHTEFSRRSNHTIAAQKSELNTLSTELKLVQDEVAELRRVAQQRAQAFEELQRQCDDLAAAQDASRTTLTDDGSWAVVREELHRQAEHTRAVEAENARMHADFAVLKQRHENIEVLREQKRDLERRVRGVDELHEKVAQLEGELAAARKEREEWCVDLFVAQRH